LKYLQQLASFYVGGCVFKWVDRQTASPRTIETTNPSHQEDHYLLNIDEALQHLGMGKFQYRITPSTHEDYHIDRIDRLDAAATVLKGPGTSTPFHSFLCVHGHGVEPA
jgi:hypothetical protein